MNVIKILALFALLFVTCSALHLVEPTTAVTTKGYLIDKGTEYLHGYAENERFEVKYTWKTYLYTKNKRKIIFTSSIKDHGKWINTEKNVVILQKISKTKMKITSDFLYPKVKYVKTKLSTRNYYWKIYRPTKIANAYYINY